MTAPDEIKRLVDVFDSNIDSYKNSNYNETQVRQEFIDPFFVELGWDVTNREGYAEAYKDVVLEDKIKIGSATKAPDYSFRIGGVRKFFLEAKRPSVNIQTNINPAYQLRRYAWSAKLPISILTDFEEFSIYDCKARPHINDKATNSIYKYYKYTEYVDKWEEIYNIFSKEAILKGSFDKFVAGTKKIRGTAEVDDAFLQEMETWRDALARNFALRNPNLSTRALNEAVQKTIDRIIFLRICEDRGIEPYGQLQKMINVNDVYSHLRQLFLRADDKYNSGLFHFKSEKGRKEFDNFTLEQNLDDKPVKDIIKRLYYPESPYEFSVLPADILGQVYERFLGKVIRLTDGHRAKIEEKPEVRKAGGVYYTPTYIVEYIVKNTVGKLLEKKTPSQAAKIRILDPACGSGSFLLGAYQYLLDWHLEQYTADTEKNSKGKHTYIYKTVQNEWKLTTEVRLINNIHGVDIDSQAVEVSKLSLLLKVLEGETNETLNQQTMFAKRALPDLHNNIKCGNSLIGSDFYDGKDLQLFNADDMHRINCFDWDLEFKDIMADGGFDAVIGNPPYVSVKAIEKDHKEYYLNKYFVATGQFDLYSIFIEKGVEILKFNAGMFGMITSNTYLSNKDTKKLRKFILNESNIEEIINFGETVFKDASLDVSILLLNRTKNKSVTKVIQNRHDFFNNKYYKIHQEEWMNSSNYEIQINLHPEELEFIRKIYYDKELLEKYLLLPRGIEIGGNSELIENQFIDDYGKLLVGRNIDRYRTNFADNYIKHNPNNKSVYKDFRIYKQKKILIQRIRNLSLNRRIVATLDTEGYLCTNTLRIGISKSNELGLEYIIGILNSSIINWIFLKKFLNKDIYAYQLKQLPIKTIDFSNEAEKGQHDKMVNLVEQMLEAQKEAHDTSGKSESVIKIDKQRCELLDRQIDALVYELYGLTDDEIKIVEG